MDEREREWRQKWAARCASLASEAERVLVSGMRAVLRENFGARAVRSVGGDMPEKLAKVLVERCAHESDSGVVYEFSAAGVTRRYVSCGLPACNRAGEEWMQAELRRPACGGGPGGGDNGD